MFDVGLNLSLPSRLSLQSQAFGILRKFGSNAHVYLPGAGGVAVSGLSTGNYTDQTLTTYASVDGTVGGVVDPVGGINATQSTAGNRPLVKQTSGKYYWQFDGTNDSLALGSVPFQMSDDHCVVAAFKPSAFGTFAGVFCVGGATPTPEVALIGTNSDGTAFVFYRDDAGTNAFLSLGAISLGTAYVVSARKSGTTVQARLNSGAWVSQVVSFGATTLTTALIGAVPASGTQYFNGAIYYCNPIKGTVSDADLLVDERFAGALAGVYF